MSIPRWRLLSAILVRLRTPWGDTEKAIGYFKEALRIFKKCDMGSSQMALAVEEFLASIKKIPDVMYNPETAEERTGLSHPDEKHSSNLCAIQ